VAFLDVTGELRSRDIPKAYCILFADSIAALRELARVVTRYLNGYTLKEAEVDLMRAYL
jgi:hypothetical protein